MAQTEAQKAATKRWREKNREKSNHNAKLNNARSFIRKSATLENLEELEQLIADRKKELK